MSKHSLRVKLTTDEWQRLRDLQSRVNRLTQKPVTHDQLIKGMIRYAGGHYREDNFVLHIARIID